MARPCSICTHPERPAIDKALVSGTAFRNVSERYGMSGAALSRHKTAHLPALLAKAQALTVREEAARGGELVAQAEAQEAQEVRHALDVVKELRAINGVTLEILRDAREKKDGDQALRAVDRIARQIELQAKLLGELKPDGAAVTVNLGAHPHWPNFFGRLLETLKTTLRPYPDAQRDVAEALQGMEWQ